MTSQVRHGTRKDRRRVQPYLSAELAKRFEQHCAAVGATESAVIEAALTEYLDRTNDHALLMRRLDRVGRAIANVHRDVGIQLEQLALFIQVWYGHMPVIPAENAKAAQHLSARRYAQYLDRLRDTLAKGEGRFLNSLAKDVADPAELDALRNRVAAAHATEAGAEDPE